VNCNVCNSKFTLAASFKKPQFKEKIFTSLKKFSKKIYFCKTCDHHLIKSYNYKLNDEIYKKSYGIKAYGNLVNRFNKISSLKKDESSNFHRRKFILQNFNLNKNHKLLDFGSGLGIFPHSIRKDCKCFFYEKDRVTRKFCINQLNLKFVSLKNLKSKIFDFITCNKVLEHLNIEDIKKCLKKFKKTLKNNGKIYIELPSINANKLGYDRQEFFSEHINLFSEKSAQAFFRENGFKIEKLLSIIEKGDKFTMRIVIVKIVK
jgi:ubiquinone/menaquinone biosynthesis C-methylase UbiE